MMSARSEIAGTESQAVARSVLIGLFILFFASGALALIYEVIWQRHFALVFGSAAPATAALLAAYFTGLGLGSRLLGAAAAKWKHPLRAYAVLEVLIGAGALLVTPLLHGFETVYPWLFERFAASSSLFFLAKSFFAFVSIGIPTFCMGGTLPAVGQFVDRGQRRLGISAGLLYVANTLGAAMGALSVPFVFLPMLGARGTVWFCVSGNVFVALAAWWLDRVASASRGCVGASSAQAGKHEGRKETARPEETHLPSLPIRPVLALSLLSGFITFVLQVLWNRAFAQVHENSMYSFAVISAVFILALAAGAQFARMALRRKVTPDRLIGWSWFVSGVLVALTPWLFLQLTNGLTYVPSQGGWTQYAGRLVVLAVAVLFAPVTLLGMALPILMDEAGQRRLASPGNLLGQVLAVNVLGSVGGAITAGFLLPQMAGLWTSIFFCGAILVFAGCWQFHSGPT
ncbi:MAG: hypothetical protein L0Z50_17970, partial [Verrucomicrobiales bacterium]|nr:hypothetical protein [Verrucomicrobiales bacterium]